MASQSKIVENIQLALLDILNPENVNRWISVNERPMSKIVAEAGLHKSYATTIMEELRKIGLIESEGQKIGLRYKIITTVYPDVSFLAEKIYNKQLQKTREYLKTRKHVGDGYPNSSASDLKPKFAKEPVDKTYIRESKKSLTTQARVTFLPNLNSICYFINDNKITEGRVISIGYESVDSNVIIVDVEYVRCQGLDDISYIRKMGLNLSQIFSTPKDAADFLVSKLVHYVRRK